jgi:hypothetical protein
MLMSCCAYSCTHYMLLTHADILLCIQLHTVQSPHTVHASNPCWWLSILTLIVVMFMLDSDILWLTFSHPLQLSELVHCITVLRDGISVHWVHTYTYILAFCKLKHIMYLVAGIYHNLSVSVSQLTLLALFCRSACGRLTTATHISICPDSRGCLTVLHKFSFTWTLW